MKFLQQIIVIVSLIISLAGFLFSSRSLATTVPPPYQPTGLPTSLQSSDEAVDRGVNIAIEIAGVVLLIVLLVGGILYLTAGGNEEAETTAKRMLIYAMVGIVIVTIAYAVMNWIMLKLLER